MIFLLVIIAIILLVIAFVLINIQGSINYIIDLLMESPHDEL